MFENISTKSITFNLVAANVIVFLLANSVFPSFNEWFALHYFANPAFKPIQIVTHMFMHGSFLHIFFNMFSLYMFGSVLERVWGPQRFLLYYFTTGLGAVILHMGVQALIVYNFTGTVSPTEAMIFKNPGVMETFFSATVGASGAVYGILIAFGVLFPNTELMVFPLPIPIKAKYLVTGLVCFELYNGIVMSQGDNVAHFAHLGGALFGFLLVKYWNRNRNSLY